MLSFQVERSQVEAQETCMAMSFTKCLLHPNGDPVGIHVVTQVTSLLRTTAFLIRSSAQAQMISFIGSMRGGIVRRHAPRKASL